MSSNMKPLKPAKTKISTDLGDPRLLRLLKAEAQETGSTIREVLVQALESYFAHKLETRALLKASETSQGVPFEIKTPTRKLGFAKDIELLAGFDDIPEEFEDYT